MRRPIGVPALAVELALADLVALDIHHGAKPEDEGLLAELVQAPARAVVVAGEVKPRAQALGEVFLPIAARGTT